MSSCLENVLIKEMRDWTILLTLTIGLNFIWVKGTGARSRPVAGICENSILSGHSYIPGASYTKKWSLRSFCPAESPWEFLWVCKGFKSSAVCGSGWWQNPGMLLSLGLLLPEWNKTLLQSSAPKPTMTGLPWSYFSSGEAVELDSFAKSVWMRMWYKWHYQ